MRSPEFHKEIQDSIIMRVDNKDVEGSNWTLVNIPEFHIRYFKHSRDVNGDPSKGKNYVSVGPCGSYVDWPTGEFAGRTHIINIKIEVN